LNKVKIIEESNPGYSREEMNPAKQEVDPGWIEYGDLHKALLLYNCKNDDGLGCTRHRGTGSGYIRQLS
jgi:hypothetical protein